MDPLNNEGRSHSNHPHFYNQPHYQMPGGTEPVRGDENNLYVKLLIEENNKLKKEVEIMSERFEKLKKGVGNKKRKILNEIVSLICTKNAFESRFVSEITQCPYKEVIIEKNVTERVFTQANHS